MLKYSDENFIKNLQNIEACATMHDLENALNEFLGLQAYIIQFVRTHENGGRKNYVAVTNGMPQVLLDYLEKNYSDQMGPVGKFLIENGRPVWLSKIMNEPAFIASGYTKNLQALFELIGDGIFIPTYYKNHWGVVLATFGKSQNECSDILIWQIETLFHQIHIRYRCLRDEFQTSVNLTKREVDVIELLSMGKTNIEIALILGLQPSTVGSYVKTIYLKLGVTNRVAATLRAIYLGLGG